MMVVGINLECLVCAVTAAGQYGYFISVAKRVGETWPGSRKTANSALGKTHLDRCWISLAHDTGQYT